MTALRRMAGRGERGTKGRNREKRENVDRWVPLPNGIHTAHQQNHQMAKNERF
jgi:hypothetical protein